MAIPDEILLDILHLLDYSSLLCLRFAASRFYHVIERSERKLAKRQELTLGVWPGEIRLAVDEYPIFRTNHPLWFGITGTGSFEEALAAAGAVAALQPIVSVEIFCKVIESGHADEIFSYLPSAAYARNVNPYFINEGGVKKAQLESFFARFLSLDSATFDSVPADFDWTILRSEPLLRLPNLCISPETDFRGNGKVHLTETAMEEIVSFCRDFSKLQPGQSRFLGLRTDWQFSSAFVKQLIEARESSPRHVTVDIQVELYKITHEEWVFPDYDEHVLVPRLELGEDHFEQRLGSPNEAFRDGRRWADVAYHSRHSPLVAYVICHEHVPDMARIGITNDPIQKEDYEEVFPQQ